MSHHPVSESSPYKPTAACQDPIYLRGDMTTSRNLFVDDIGSVPQIPVSDFLAHFMPPVKLDKDELDAVFDKLCEEWRPTDGVSLDTIVEKEILSDKWQTAFAPYDKKLGVWSDYAKEPKDRPGKEKIVYADLDDICEQIVACCKEVKADLKQATRLISNDERLLRGPKSNSAPLDAVHLFLDERGNVAMDVHDCVCNSEFRKATTSKDTLDNNRKTIWGMHHVMRTDARRRFTTGMSFSNTGVRLWHYNREVIVVSAPFDFNKNCAVLIEVYVRLAFATMTELGYDPTMEILPLPAGHADKQTDDNGGRQFRIRVGDTDYITVETLADHGPEEGFGRCTRVFAAYKEHGKHDELFAIKDCWVDATRKTEYEILKLIKAAIVAYDWDNNCGPPIANAKDLVDYDGPPIDPRYKTLTLEERIEFFVSIVDGLKVSIDDLGGVEDDTQEVIARGYKFSDKREMYAVGVNAIPLSSKQSTRASIWHGTVGVEAILAQPQEKLGRFFRPIVPRAHHRLVMEMGTPLSEIQDAATAFGLVSDASYAVFMLHCIDWLHRDISADNILQTASGRGVLADLEYAKLASDPLTRSFRTGTPDFIAVEVAMCSYLSAEDDESNPFDHEAEPETDDTALSWRFRDIHDLESLWWLCLWLLFRSSTNLDTPTSYSLTKQTAECIKIFPGILKLTKERRELLMRSNVLNKALLLLPPAWKDAMRRSLSVVRHLLCEGYGAEKTGKALHPGFWWMVHDMALAGKSIQGKLVRISQQQVDQMKEQDAKRVTAEAAAGFNAEVAAAQAESRSAISTDTQQGDVKMAEAHATASAQTTTSSGVPATPSRKRKASAEESLGERQGSPPACDGEPREEAMERQVKRQRQAEPPRLPARTTPRTKDPRRRKLTKPKSKE
ncbi:hypothetical protein BD626DRAFT_535003 [Schizophyllum amplum]|uniref:Fungal-type protein kinase domain-containing protein n=1 Tax=Schizophyllum amplum TaxID=97359 RepID=A0A550CQE9_9AGAR|nr:hypothetical protein BD626DRAFT_535003 [Auriculariopsis ampla]